MQDEKQKLLAELRSKPAFKPKIKHEPTIL